MISKALAKFLIMRFQRKGEGSRNNCLLVESISKLFLATYDWFRDKIRTLNKLGYIQEVKSGNKRKIWKIHPDKDSETLIQEYKYNYRSQRKNK